MKKKRRKKVSLGLRLLSKLIFLISLVCTIFFLYELNKINVLPTKYFIIVFGIMSLLLFIIGLLILRKHSDKKIITTGLFILIIYLIIILFGSLRIKDTISFMEKNLGAKFDTNIYYVLVNNDSDYMSIDDIENKIIYSYKDLDDKNIVIDELKKKVNVDIEYESSIYDLLNDLTSDTSLVALVNSGNYDVMVQNNEGYSSKVRILDTIEIKTKKETKQNDVKVNEEPFVILINGIDTRSDYLPSRSLSDVNIIMAINTNTHEILLIHIPRDYYLEIPGTGYRDKLTHTGTIGGVNTTIETIENAFDIDIPYYIRVNFNFVTNLVDSVDGINIYNDLTYSFSTTADSECIFDPEWNYDVSGRCALAFARERYIYETGDNHRGENQQHVIEQLFKKLTTSKTLISNYKDILNALDGTFETNLSNEDITSLVKLQIDKMPDWTIHKYSLTGYGMGAYTYSYPNQELYVMEPDDESMEEAKNKLRLILDTNIEE